MNHHPSLRTRCLFSSQTVLVIALGTAVLSACVTPPPPAPPAPSPAPAPVAAAPAPAPPSKPAPAPAPAPVLASPGATALKEGIRSFEIGEYRKSETRLADSLRQGLNNKDEQLRAYKTQAFVYCVTKRATLCEKSFQSAFAADRNFDLTRAERGHPVWGPVFTKVQTRQKPG